MKTKITGRSRWLCTFLSVPLLLTGLFGFATAHAKDFVIASWGDPYKACWAESIIPEFETKHGVEVVYTEGFSSKTLGKLRAQKAKPEIDIAMFDDGPFYQAVQLGLMQELDFSKLPNANDLYAMAQEPKPHGILFAAAGTGLWYNTKIFKEKGWAPPTSWTDLFRPEFALIEQVRVAARGYGLRLGFQFPCDYQHVTVGQPLHIMMMHILIGAGITAVLIEPCLVSVPILNFNLPTGTGNIKRCVLIGDFSGSQQRTVFQ